MMNHSQSTGNVSVNRGVGGHSNTAASGGGGKQPLWIDRRWNGGDYEKNSNSSEKKLLGNTANADNEYAYIDRRNLSTFHSSSSSNYENASALGQQQQHPPQSRSPEPYATTNIFREAPAYAISSVSFASFEFWALARGAILRPSNFASVCHSLLCANFAIERDAASGLQKCTDAIHV